jgi:hypothetical protein
MTCFLKHLSKREISRREHVSLGFVMACTQSPDQNFSAKRIGIRDDDGRGWPKNKWRRYSEREEARVVEIYRELAGDPQEYFTGASAILQHYLKRYPDSAPLSLRFIGRTLAKHHLTQPIRKRQRGASRNLHYPEHSLNQLGASRLEVDFIGKKFIRSQSEPINFIAFSLRFPRITSESADEVIRHCQAFFRSFEKPQVVKIDNGFTFAGSGPWPRTLSKVILFLLKEQILPVFTAPRKPWNQASVEGSNSIFARKFWQRFQFTSVEEIDEKLHDFNLAYQRFLGYSPPRQVSAIKLFVPKLYFMRKVYQRPEHKDAYIEVAKERVLLPRGYINLFVLAEWNLVKEQLTIYLENDLKLITIHECPFKINQKSKIKLF